MTAIRAGTAADVVPLRALNDALLEVKYDDAFYATLFGATADDGPAPLVFVAPAATPSPAALWGALSARIVAPAPASGGVWAWLCGRRTAAAPRAEPATAYIMTLCVAPEARRRGVARGLVRALLVHLAGMREVGDGVPVGAVELHVLSTNEAALALYGCLGFSRVAEVRHYYHFSGAHHDAVLMRLQLEEVGGRASAAVPVEEEARPWAPLGWLMEALRLGAK